MKNPFGYTGKTGKDWFIANPYGDKEIEGIKDPEGGSELTLPTAIPSPFARIDLVKAAFNNAVKSPDLKFHEKNGDVVCSKEDELLVSHCLDLAEMLFNYDSVKENVRIIAWDRESDLNKLKNGTTAHRKLAETIELYLDQDKRSYNFDLLQRFFLIEYDHKIIGCTSPSTLFFTSANNIKHAQIRLSNNHLLFGSQFTPLYERENEFQKYLHQLLESNSLLKSRLKEFSDYVEKSLKILSQKNSSLYSEIKKLDRNQFTTSYSELTTGTDNDVVEVVGVSLRKRKAEDIAEFIAANSDFRLRSTKHTGRHTPLVLQNDFSKPWVYAKDKWSKVTVPYIDANPISKRRLPGVNVAYPFLTVSDLLEPYLIRLVYPINKEKFFDGNLKIESGNDSNGYILPLKPKFFEYFNSSDLLSAGSTKPKIEIIQGVASSVKVLLKLPVTRDNEFITFERIYMQSPEHDRAQPDESKNKGVIVEQQFGITLFPFIKTNQPALKPYYRVQLVDRDVLELTKGNEYDLNFFKNSESEAVTVRAKKTRSDKRRDAGATTQYYVLKDEFDYIQVKNLSGVGASGILLPNWVPFVHGNEAFSFAIDFGTTNTHIEYSVGGGSPRPFDITSGDLQIATLFNPANRQALNASGAIAIEEQVEYEFIPHRIGDNSDYKFPQRTIISESHSLNIETETYSLADFNIPFVYEKKKDRDKIQSNLKWAKREKGNEKRVRAFFEKLIMLMRNKVLLNRGNLALTKLVWFYPSSMKPGRRSSLENTWRELFEEYFNPVQKPIGIAESLAPFYYFKGVNKLQGGLYKPVVSIDIGGGTTDIVIYKGGKPLWLTSFKFAANSIFGDGFSEYGAANSNGIISKYFPHFESLLTANTHRELAGILSTIKDKNKAEDINAFFFSLEANPKIKDKKLFSYNSILSRDEDLKIVFIYFYCSIVYHIASLMRSKAIELPKHLVFSGTGSKILSIMSSDSRALSNLSKLIFEHVYENKFDQDGLTIETERDFPKEVTCKGGLMVKAEDLDIDVKDIKVVHNGSLINGASLTYEKLDESVKRGIVREVEMFNNLFVKLNQQVNFIDHFSVSPKAWEVFKNEFSKHQRDYLEEGLQFNKKMDDVTDDKELEESLFFYPLTGAINHLASHLSTLSHVNI